MVIRGFCVLLATVSASVIAGSAPAAESGRSDPEVASIPFRISEVGPAGDAAYDASTPAVASNPTAREYLVVWAADHTGDDEFEIYGQRINALTGQQVGPNDFRISNVGADGDATRDAGNPAIVYNPDANEYLVVWEGDDNRNYDNDYEIYGQRLSATGEPIGGDFAITVTGPSEPVVDYCASGPGAVTCPPHLWQTREPGIAYNTTTGEYLVVFRTTEPTMRSMYLSDVSSYIRVVRLNAAGAATGTTTVDSGRSYLYGREFTSNHPDDAAIAYNPSTNEFLVAYVYSRKLGVNYYYSLNVQRFDAAGTNRSATSTLQALSPYVSPRVVHNATANEFLVAYTGSAIVGGHRVSAAGAFIQEFTVAAPVSGVSVSPVAVALDRSRNEYLWSWWRSPTVAGSQPTLNARIVSAAGAAVGDAFPIAVAQTIEAPAVASGGRGYLIAWGSDHNLTAGEVEIFASSYTPPGAFVVGFGRSGDGRFQRWTRSERGATQQLPWPVYNTANGELRPALGDVDGDGLDEVVMGLGLGGDGYIAIFDDAAHAHALLTWIRLPWPTYNANNGTIWPAVGDIDGDGKAEIVAGLGTGGGGWYGVFDDAATGFAFSTWRRLSWPSYNNTQSGETHPAIVNIDGGINSEIVIGLGAGGGGWLELVDDAGANYAHLRWLRVGWGAYVAGPGQTYPAAGDLDGDGYDEIVIGLGANSQGWLQVIDDAFAGLQHKAWLQVNWNGYAAVNGETHPAVGDVDGDAAHEIVLGLGVMPGEGGWFEIRDDFTAGFTSLGWRNVGDSALYVAGGATFPAAGRSQ